MFLLLVLACAPTGTPADSGQPAALPDPWTDYYHVESVILAGGFSFDETYWARRALDPQAGTIDEDFVAEADGTLTLTHIVVDDTAGTFTLDINDGEYTGEGTLVGAPWAWTAWSSRSTATDGTYVLSEDTVTDEGITASKEGYSEDDALEWTLDEVLTQVSEAEWQAGMDALGR